MEIENTLSSEVIAPAAAEGLLAGTRVVEIVRRGFPVPEVDRVAEEIPAALVYNGISHAVMMTTPSMLEEFAVGFSLSEAIVPDASHIYSVEVSDACRGKQINVEISSECFQALKLRRRSMTGRTGCGICGVESLDAAVRPPRRVPFTQAFDMRHYGASLHALDIGGSVRSLTGCAHSALWVSPSGEVLASTEDVGRHVALDKLLGVRSRGGFVDGALFVSSRASYEMVLKAANCGVEIMFAVSAPTALAIEVAEQAGVTLLGFCRGRGANAYTHPGRLVGF